MAWIRFRKRDMPGGLWTKCPACQVMLYQKDLQENCHVCAKCEHHLKINVAQRLEYTLDEGSFQEIDAAMGTVDALDFVDRTKYDEKLERNFKKTGRREAMVIGTGRLRGREVVFGALEFDFLGGSMGVVVGEKVTRAAELACERQLPLVLFSASGGARMHEGALSLMQMAKSCAALARLHEAGGVYVCVLTHPTTGGVTASWATVADLILAEPGALIGFAGPRVIQNTIRQDLPKGFQRSEFLLERGMIDRIVSRTALVDTLDQLFAYLLGPIKPLEVEVPDPAIEESPAGGSSNGSPGRDAETPEPAPESTGKGAGREDRQRKARKKDKKDKKKASEKASADRRDTGSKRSGSATRSSAAAAGGRRRGGSRG